ncbi:hypothetical protein LT335_00339 [Spiroplasma sp. JKS002669]|uniref:hypothetical protein n=1 Tax=Spiroplasma attinicola TaxID=2904537 RepID=UPI002022B8EF|nr:MULTISPECIES: hypothetical protein [unclassified Spiroplasma]MCL6428791.1 hypothetical protein [Spiroplasma sp. JKS002669]MCL8210215.1 hypothetical protein [Spiroplasma sp. JKS002670]MCL8210724.1 hypothetical protein [Spiroplasma sp. JKS002671]
MLLKLNAVTSNFSLFTNTTARYLILAFTIVMVLYVLISIFWRWLKKDKYQGSRFTTKNIAYITMLTSVSVVMTILVSVTIPITVLPPVRLAIEGLMIKITGYLFGPIIGIISGTITDMLVMLFVPSYINPVYIFCIILTGFFAGIGGVAKFKLKNHPWTMFILVNLLMLFFIGGGSYLVWQYPANNIPLSAGIVMNKYAVVAIIAGGGVFTLLVIYLVLFYYLITKKKERINEVLPIILLTILVEYVVTVLIASYADMSFLSSSSTKDYGLTMIARLVAAPIQIIFNVIIIYVTWRTVSPLINIDNLN